MPHTQEDSCQDPHQDLPGLEKTSEEIDKALKQARAFCEGEHSCPNCRHGQPDDPTVVWSTANQKFLCFSCKWVDTRLTTEAKGLWKKVTK